MLLYFSHLPVQCLCEFLLSSTVDKQHKQQQLVGHLRSVLMDPNQDPNAPCEVLEYFLRRLHSTQSASRLQAIKVMTVKMCGFCATILLLGFSLQIF